MNRDPSDNVVLLPPHGRPPRMGNLLPCRVCSTQTATATLSHYGGMCFPCYGAYCREPQPRVDAGDKRRDLRDWAAALKGREEAGDQLTQAQRDMWRAAIRPHRAMNHEEENPC